MTRIRQATVRVLAGVLLVVSSLLIATTPSAAAVPPVFTSLTMQNGWTTAVAGTGNAGATVIYNNIVHLKGTIKTTGTSRQPFTLPTAFRPATNVYVAVSLCGGDGGRLFITPQGVVTVQARNFANAKCLTSLDGVSYAKSTLSFVSLTLQNGWTNAPFSTSAAAARVAFDVVHLKGAIKTAGTNAAPFVLPVALRPAANVYVPVDLCTAGRGRLFIQPNGGVVLQAPVLADAFCFTSLDGVTYRRSATGVTPLSLQNGWTNAAFGTGAAGGKLTEGLVRLRGGIKTANTSPSPFVVPGPLRPFKYVVVMVNVCGGMEGRLVVAPTGVVEIQAPSFADATCFTSLDGVSFAR